MVSLNKKRVDFESVIVLAIALLGKFLSPRFHVIRDDYRSLPLKKQNTHTYIHKVALKTLYFKFV